MVSQNSAPSNLMKQILDPRHIAGPGVFDDERSGRETLSDIERTIEDLRTRERGLHAELEAITTNRSKLIEQRLAAYRELAEVRTRHAISDGVIDEADRLSARVQNLLVARQNTIEDLKSRLAGADEKHAALVRARDGLSDRIEKLEIKLDELALKARETLASNFEYRRELEAFEHAGTTLTKAADKAERAEKDRVEKGRAYQSDPIFMYLWQRKFGTNAYKQTGIIRWLDRMVADLILYHGARANFAVLVEIPVRLKAHVQALVVDRAAKQMIVDTRETEMIRELAEADLPGQLREARATEAENQQSFEQIAAQLSDVGEQMNAYAEGQDTAFKKAVEISAEFLGQERTARLMQIARETTIPSDDQIAARIVKLDADVSKATSEIDAKTQGLEKLFDKRDELVRIAANFRRAHYDDGASVFRGNDVGSVLLEELLRGALTGADYWARTRSRQSWRHRPADPYRRSESFPPFDDVFGGSGNDSWGSGGGDSWSHGDDDFGTDGGF
jgi:hypothetical protein